MAKKPAAIRTTTVKRGTPVAMPMKTKSNVTDKMPKMPGNIATGLKKKATVKPTGKVTKKPTTKPKPKKIITERDILDVKNMTPAQKAAYLERSRRGY